jgi:hypothetical protein
MSLMKPTFCNVQYSYRLAEVNWSPIYESVGLPTKQQETKISPSKLLLTISHKNPPLFPLFFFFFFFSYPPPLIQSPRLPPQCQLTRLHQKSPRKIQPSTLPCTSWLSQPRQPHTCSKPRDPTQEQPPFHRNKRVRHLVVFFQRLPPRTFASKFLCFPTNESRRVSPDPPLLIQRELP